MLVGQHRLTRDLGIAGGDGAPGRHGQRAADDGRVRRPAPPAIDDGRVDAALVDLAVERILRLKFRLGLFERPYVEPPSAASLAALDADERALAARPRARRSSSSRTTGSCRSPPTAAGSRSSARSPTAPATCSATTPTCPTSRRSPSCATGANPFGFPASDVIQPVDELARQADDPAGAPRPVRRRAIVHARGTGLRDGTDEEIAEAVAAARDADVAIVVLGERSGLTDDATTGESRDRRDLGLLGRQQELLEAVVATGTPTVLVVVSGRPLAIEWAAQHCAAVLLAWVPGEAGPAAIAEVLAGDVDPGGRLPVTVPRHVGQVPLTYRHHPTGGRSNWKVDYVDGPVVAAVAVRVRAVRTRPFAFDHLRVDRPVLDDGGDAVRSGSTSRTPAPRPGDEVVQLYVRDEEATVARPVLSCAGSSGCASRRASAGPSLPPLDRAARLRRRRPPGRRAGPRRLSVGRSSADLPLTAELDARRPAVELVERHDYLTDPAVE